MRKFRDRGALVLAVLAFASTARAATYCVDETADPGAGSAADCVADAPCGSANCSLREAVAQANVAADADTITFTAASITIDVGSELVLTQSVTIDGGASIHVGLNCATTCFKFTNGASILRGLAMGGAGGEAVRIETSGIQVLGNYIGLTPSGANNGNTIGVHVVSGSFTIIGGPSEAEGNVISRNGTGIAASVPVRIWNNLIGTDPTGLIAKPNASVGISIISGSGSYIGAPGWGNVISGNGGPGIIIANSASDAVIEGNLVGLGKGGIVPLPNGTGTPSPGMDLSGSGHVIGGINAGAGNTISGNVGAGVDIKGTGIVLLNNTIGLDANSVARGNNGDGVKVRTGASAGIGRNVISGNMINGVFLENGAQCNFNDNLIGTDPTGNIARGNTGDGIFTGANNYLVFLSNVISGNDGSGVSLNGGTGHVFHGNRIGLGTNGAKLGNGAHGLALAGASSVSIGGVASGDGNFISGNALSGVIVTGGNSVQIQGNTIGLGIDGSSLRPNDVGITINAGSTGVSIGDSASGARNVVSGNTHAGIRTLANGTWIVGNFVGTNASGSAAAANGGNGIEVLSANLQVGDGVLGFGNVISGNLGNGLAITGAGATNVNVRGNIIGVGADGTTEIGNGLHGVAVTSGAAFLSVGGPGLAANVIAHNALDGIAIDTSNVEISGNSIFANGGLGIDWLADGPTDNDTGGDLDVLQNRPSFSFARVTPGATHFEGSVQTNAGRTVRVEIFHSPACDASGSGEGQTLLYSLDQTSDGAGTVAFSVDLASELPAGTQLTATATNISGSLNTSEFSLCSLAARPGVVAIAPVAGAIEGGSAQFTLIRTFGSDGAVDVSLLGSGDLMPSEYTLPPTVTLADGESMKTFSVPLADNAADDPVRSLTITVTSVSGGGAVGAPTSATDSVADNDDVCGNGEIEPSETCDDSNLMAGDGCSAGCQTEQPPEEMSPGPTGESGGTGGGTGPTDTLEPEDGTQAPMITRRGCLCGHTDATSAFAWVAFVALMMRRKRR